MLILYTCKGRFQSVLQNQGKHKDAFLPRIDWIMVGLNGLDWLCRPNMASDIQSFSLGALFCRIVPCTSRFRLCIPSGWCVAVSQRCLCRISQSKMRLSAMALWPRENGCSSGTRSCGGQGSLSQRPSYLEVAQAQCLHCQASHPLFASPYLAPIKSLLAFQAFTLQARFSLRDRQAELSHGVEASTSFTLSFAGLTELMDPLNRRMLPIKENILEQSALSAALGSPNPRRGAAISE